MPHTVRYTFKGDLMRDLPLIVAELPVLSKAYYTTKPFDRDHARSAARLRPLRDRRLQARHLRHLQAPRRLLGQGSAGQPRPLQFRRAALRVLPRPHRSNWRTCSSRHLRLARGVHLARLGDGLRHAAGQGRPHPAPDAARRAARPARRASSSTRAATSSRTVRVRKALDSPSTSSGPTRTCSTASTRAPAASSRTPT